MASRSREMVSRRRETALHWIPSNSRANEMALCAQETSFTSGVDAGIARTGKWNGLRGEDGARAGLARHCYPNPFSPRTAIEYTFPSDTRVTLNVYSIHGRKAATLVDAHQSAGLHTAVYTPATTASAGMYFYTLITTEVGAAGRMVFGK
jgi:hypothetical protein